MVPSIQTGPQHQFIGNEMMRQHRAPSIIVEDEFEPINIFETNESILRLSAMSEIIFKNMIGQILTDDNENDNQAASILPSVSMDDDDDDKINCCEMGCEDADPQPIYPQPHDIICGRGRAYWNHPGNCAFREWISRNASLYVGRGKSRIASQVLESLTDGTAWRELHHYALESPPRILKYHQEQWIDVSKPVAREKVAQGLRDCLSARNAQARQRKRGRDDDSDEHEAKRHFKPRTFNDDMEHAAVLQADDYIRGRIEQLHDDVGKIMSKYGTDPTGDEEGPPDDVMLELFEVANRDLLRAIKENSEEVSADRNKEL